MIDQILGKVSFYSIEYGGVLCHRSKFLTISRQEASIFWEHPQKLPD